MGIIVNVNENHLQIYHEDENISFTWYGISVQFQMLSEDPIMHVLHNTCNIVRKMINCYWRLQLHSSNFVTF